MRIFVGGSLQDVPRESDLCRQFVNALGTEIVRQGHVLLNGCRSTLDLEIATTAQKWLTRNEVKPRERIISYFLSSEEPIHAVGKSVAQLFLTGI